MLTKYVSVIQDITKVQLLHYVPEIDHDITLERLYYLQVVQQYLPVILVNIVYGKK